MEFGKENKGERSEPGLWGVKVERETGVRRQLRKTIRESEPKTTTPETDEDSGGRKITPDLWGKT